MSTLLPAALHKCCILDNHPLLGVPEEKSPEQEKCPDKQTTQGIKEKLTIPFLGKHPKYGPDEAPRWLSLSGDKGGG